MEDARSSRLAPRGGCEEIVKGFLLAAGVGTRLRPLTNTIPKCLVPIQGTPLLAMDMKLNAFFRFDGPQNDRAEKGEEGEAAVRNSDPEPGPGVAVKEVRR